MTSETPGARAKRRAYRKILGAHARSHEHQVRRVRASQNEDEANGRANQQERR